MNMSSRQGRNYTVAVLLLWFLTALTGGWFDIFTSPGKPPIAIGLFLVVPILFFCTWYLAGGQFRAFANSLNLAWIVGAHLWRFVGLGFVIAVFLRKLPAGFGIPEGFGDVVTAAFALPLAGALHRKKAVRKGFIAWNIFGLVDLLSAILMGVLYSEGSFGILRTDVSTVLMTTFPVSIIPTFLVPLFILLHLLALARRREAAPALESGVFRLAEGAS
jgi:hypothetical protein